MGRLLDDYLADEPANSDEILALVRIAIRVYDHELGERDSARVLDATLALIPPLEETFRQQKNLLAVLLGRTPESFDTKTGDFELQRGLDVLGYGGDSPAP